MSTSTTVDLDRLKDEPFPESGGWPDGRAGTFGPTLKHYRERLHLSQSNLAKRAGCDHSYVSRLESGARMPTRGAVDRLAAAMKLEPEERDRLLQSAGFLGGATIDLADFRAWLDEGIRLLARAEGS